LAGVNVLGLATEVQKLSVEERRAIIATIAREVSGSGILSVTVAGPSIGEQRALVGYALDHGADFIILQPPDAGAFGGAVYIDFFLRVAEGFDTRFAIQNAPQYLGRALSRDDIGRLRAANPRFDIIKAETSPVDLAALCEAAGPDLSVLNGRGGLEMTDSLRAGASGFILAPDAVDYGRDVFAAYIAGRTADAEDIHRQALPAIVFVMQSIEHLIAYGKRLFGLRAGFQIYDRAPSLAPTEFGLATMQRWAEALGPLSHPRPGSTLSGPSNR
ncbi:MAG: dihydrodipicolinate synthase family protein, partial [Pseudomonadota bacterium]